ncbi:methylated-DNA--[protein]-cysteine S-methyltransferase [Kytococcus sp. Marseille-QA3725]
MSAADTDPVATRSHRVLETPVGPVTLVGTGEVLEGVYWPDHRPAPDRSTFGPEDPTALTAAAEQLTEYFAGRRTAFDLTTDAHGTAFQEAVWEQLCAIPVGETRTYGQIAAAIGNPRAVRAVGAANSRNPLSVVVPCHRVVSASGSAHGYAGSVETKEWLLAHEQGAGR